MISKWHILTISLIILSGCSVNTSNINYKNNIIQIEVSQTPISLKAQTVIKQTKNFVSLYLTQQILRLSNTETIVYEKVRTNLEYEFEPTIYRILTILFEHTSFLPIYHQNHLYAYQLILPNKTIINLIAHQSDSQELNLLYGMSNKKLSSIIHSLDNNAYIPKLLPTTKLPSNKKAFITKWNDWTVHFVPLVVPLARLMTPF